MEIIYYNRDKILLLKHLRNLKCTIFVFGKEIYSKIKDELPDIFNTIVFYKRLNFQVEYSYAQCIHDCLK